MAIEYQRAAEGRADTSPSIDIGAAGNDRLIVVFIAAEGTWTGFQGTVSVDGKSFTQAVVSDNDSSHLEMHTIDESALGSSNGSQAISYSGGDSTFGTQIMVFYGVKDDTLYDSGENFNEGEITIPVTGIDSVDDALVVMGVISGKVSTEFSNWTSPLTERLDSANPGSATQGSAEGVETTGQSSKTYSVDGSDSPNRMSAIVGVFEEAVEAGAGKLIDAGIVKDGLINGRLVT